MIECACGRVFATEGKRAYHVRTSPTCIRDADKHGRSVAERIYPDEQPCEVCGKVGKGRGVIDRHHRSNDRMDNSPENIAFLCRKHHLGAHRLTDGKVGGGPRPRIVALMRDRAVARAREAAALRDQGASTREIASTMGVDPSSVTRWFLKYGDAP